MEERIVNYDKRFTLPWQEHLEDICQDFRRRCNPEEWKLFFRRGEFEDVTIFEEIAISLIINIEKYHNYSKEVIGIIEERFHYSENISKYHFYVPLEFMEIYESQFVKKTEFPPYRLLQVLEGQSKVDEIWQGADEFIDTFRDLFFHGVDNPKDFYDAVESLKELKFSHPYTALFESDHYNMLGDLKSAVSCLERLEDNYYKYLQLGMLSMEAENYEEAIAIYQKAIEVGEDCLDPSLIEGMLSCYMHLDKIDELLAVIDQFIDQGYEYVVGPYKDALIKSIYESICEKPQEEIDENEALYIKEYHKVQGDYDAVLKLCQYGKRSGYTHSSWDTDKLVALFECGQFNQAEKLAVDLSNRDSLSNEDRLKVKKILARLAFEAGDVPSAYEIIDSIMDEIKSDRQFSFAVGKMFRETGRLREAYRLLTKLVFYYEEIEYYYELGLCYLSEEEGTEAAYYYLKHVYDINPEYEQVAYYVVQAAIDDGKYELAVGTYGNVKEHIGTYHRILIEGQFLEMLEKTREAENYYLAMLDKCNGSDCPKETLDQLLVRYIVMLSQRNEIFIRFERRIKKLLKKYFAGSETYVLYGSSLLEVQDFKGAANCFKKALEINCYNAAALHGLAISAIEEGEKELAQKYCDIYWAYTKSEVALSLMDFWKNKFTFGELEPGDETKIFGLCKEGMQEKALEYIIRKIDHESPAVYYRTAIEIAIHIGDVATAKEFIRKYEDVYDDENFEGDIANLKARAYVLQGAPLRAYSASLDDKSLDGQRLTALIQTMNDENREALEIFEGLIAKESNNPENYIGAAFTAYLEGYLEKSKNLALRGLDLMHKMFEYPEDFDSPEMLCDYGYLNGLAGNYEKAREAYEKALLMETCPYGYCHMCNEAHLGLAVLAHMEGREKEAQEEFEKAFSIMPNDPLGKAVYGRFYG